MTRALAIVVLLATGNARADLVEPAPEEVSPVEVRIAHAETYPLRIVAADLGSLASFGLGGLLIVAAALEGDEGGVVSVVGATFVTGGIVGYAVGAPMLHLGRGNPRGAMRSASVRVGVPLVAGMVAYLSDRQGEEHIATLGAVGGVGVAMLIDWTFLARMPATTTPFVAPAQGGGTQVGIAGSF